MFKSFIFVLDKFDKSTVKKVYLSSPDKVVMTIGEDIEYNGQQIEVTNVVFYEKGYEGKMTYGVECVILGISEKKE